MKLTRKQRRGVKKHVGRREIARKARTKTLRVLDLADQGFSAPTIARVTGLTEKTVVEVLALRED